MNLRTLMLGAIAGWALRGMVEEAEATDPADQRQVPLSPKQAALVRQALERGQQVVTQRVGGALRFLVDEGLGELDELFVIAAPGSSAVVPAPTVDEGIVYGHGDVIDVEAL